MNILLVITLWDYDENRWDSYIYKIHWTSSIWHAKPSINFSCCCHRPHHPVLRSYEWKNRCLVKFGKFARKCRSPAANAGLTPKPYAPPCGHRHVSRETKAPEFKSRYTVKRFSLFPPLLSESANKLLNEKINTRIYVYAYVGAQRKMFDAFNSSLKMKTH